MTVEGARCPLPLSVALDEGLERAHQLAPVGALGLLDRREDRVAEEPQRVVVLERQQQLEGAEIAVGRERAVPLAVAIEAELARLQRAARLVKAAPQLGGRDAAARPRPQLRAALTRRAGPPAP